MAVIEVTVPDIGDFKDVAVIELLVKVGDRVAQEQSLITVESDKASMEIPCSHAGVVRALKVGLGDKVNIGSVLLDLEVEGAVAPAPVAALAAGASPAAAAAVAPVATTAAAASEVVPAAAGLAQGVGATPAPALGATGLPHASPSVRKFARELGVPLAEVSGSGLKGRITLLDVQAFSRAVMAGQQHTQAARAALAATGAGGGAGGGAASGAGSELGLIPWPKVDFAKFGPIERKELGRIKKISAANLLRNAVMIPAVTNHDDADITLSLIHI